VSTEERHVGDPVSAEERVAGGLRIRIDRTLCVGFGECVKLSPEAFALDEESVATFAAPEGVPRETLLEACDSCPVDAITVWDASGSQIVP
jgi:ferredoxin